MPEPLSRVRHGPVEAVLLERPAGRSAEALARHWLGGRLGRVADALPLRRDARGRPALDLPGLDCNWSHSGPYLLVALGVGVRVGVDVEVPRPRPRALELARRFFHADEAAALAALPAQARESAFLRLWCAKEAILKAHGHGLSFGLDRLRLSGLDGPAPRLDALDPALGNVAAWTLRALPFPDVVGAVAWLAPSAPPAPGDAQRGATGR